MDVKFMLITLVCLQFTPTMTAFVDECEADHDCPAGHYCYGITKNCVKCTDCAMYKRYNSSKVSCVQSPENCGHCLPSFEEEVLTDGIARHKCVPQSKTARLYNKKDKDTSSNGDGLSDQPLYWWSLVLVSPVICSVILFAFCYQKRRVSRRNDEESSISRASSGMENISLVPPPPYSIQDRDRKEDSESANIESEPSTPFHHNVVVKTEKVWLQEAVPFRDPEFEPEPDPSPPGADPQFYIEANPANPQRAEREFETGVPNVSKTENASHALRQTSNIANRNVSPESVISQSNIQDHALNGIRIDVGNVLCIVNGSESPESGNCPARIELPETYCRYKAAKENARLQQSVMVQEPDPEPEAIRITTGPHTHLLNDTAGESMIQHEQEFDFFVLDEETLPSDWTPNRPGDDPAQEPTEDGGTEYDESRGSPEPKTMRFSDVNTNWFNTISIQVNNIMNNNNSKS